MSSNTVRTVSSQRHGKGRMGVRLAIGGLCLSLAGAVTAVFANTDALVARGFRVAVAADASGARAVAAAAARPSISGSEEFWLDRAVNGAIKPASWHQSAPAAAGQRFTLAANGAERTLEIVDVRAMPSGANAAAPTMLLVTCKDVNDANAVPLRLVLEPGQSLPGLPQLHSL